MKISFNVLDRQFFRYQEEYEYKALQILRSGKYVLGNEVCSFEEEFANYLGANYCVSLASGLDALWIAIKTLNIGKGDEVIVQGNTYIASIMGITINEAIPIFIEPDSFYNMDVSKIEEKITNKTKAILVTHLYGQAAQMNKILDLGKRYNLKIIEDCAQAHGARFDGKMVGTFGSIGCFSFYPSKNLGCFGDGGAVVTNDMEISQKIKIFRNYGSEKKYSNMIVGANSRLDEIQAGLLRVKLMHLNELNQERRLIAEKYLNEIKNKEIELPSIVNNGTSVWHLFIIRTASRKHLIEYLKDNGIETSIHYPIPPHLSQAYGYLKHKIGDLPITEKYANEVLSLPIYNGMTSDEQDYIIEKLNSYSH